MIPFATHEMQRLHQADLVRKARAFHRLHPIRGESSLRCAPSAEEKNQKGPTKIRCSRRWKVVALLAAGLVIGTALNATPAMGHVGGTVTHLWTKHIRPKADARYVNVGEKRPHAHAFASVPQSFANNTDTVVSLEQLPVASELTLANNRLTVTVPGVYSITGWIRWSAASSTGARTLRLSTNPALADFSEDGRPAAPGYFTAQSFTTLARLAAGQTIWLVARQTSGGSLSTTGVRSASLSVHWVSP